MARNEIICGNSLKLLPDLPRARMVFADPPDNLGLKYDSFKDERDDYDLWLGRVMMAAVFSKCDIFWLSFNSIYHAAVWWYTQTYLKDQPVTFREYIWRFTFGQHHSQTCGRGYRPLLLIKRHSVKMYPQAILEPSLRQTRYNDKRANPKGRVPSDVWEFSRVCGTFKEKRKWHPNQHPKDLLTRIVKFSCVPGDLVIDMFAGTGTMNRACLDLDVDCIGIEQSRYYCKMIRKGMIECCI